MQHIIFTDASLGEEDFSISILIGRRIKTPKGFKTQIIRTFSQNISRKAESSTEAEVEAIVKAIQLAEKIADGNVLIYTDCLNAVNMMLPYKERNHAWFEKYFLRHKKSLKHLRKNVIESPIRFEILKVKAHNGGTLNEYVDTAAKVRLNLGRHISFGEFKTKWLSYNKANDKKTSNPQEARSSSKDTDREKWVETTQHSPSVLQRRRLRRGEIKAYSSVHSHALA